MNSLKVNIIPERIPSHVAIIMDGNGRWAKEKKRPRVFGHKKGTETVRKVLEAAVELKINYLTLYTFSKDNWKRSESEVSSLMALLLSNLISERKTLMKNNVRLLAIGDLENLTEGVKAKLKETIDATAGNNGLTLVLALSYSSRSEITHTIRQIAAKIQNNELICDQIDESLISSLLYTSNIPDPELVIRTSGEFRISDFLLWQIAYSELFFTRKYWPDFDKEDFYEALLDYQSRERRFGKTSEQLKPETKNA
jgi:undecaprenyl diphosphate synthase